MGVIQYLMNHEGYMSGRHYRRPTPEQVFQACKKASPELMIADEYRLRLELEKSESEVGKVELLERKLANVETILLELQSRSNT